MSMIRDCPYPTIEFIKKIPAKYRGGANKKLLKSAPKLTESWLRRIGPILGQKITAGDSEFFRELADGVGRIIVPLLCYLPGEAAGKLDVC